MRKYLELLVRGGQENNSSLSAPLKKQLLIVGFAVAIPCCRHSPLRRSPLQSTSLERPAKRPVGRLSRVKCLTVLY